MSRKTCMPDTSYPIITKPGVHAFLIHNIRFLILTLALGPLAAFAQTFEEGKAAYQVKDYQRALEIIRPLAQKGNSQAQVTLGIMYDFGHGVPKDSQEAIKWYIKAAKQGIPIVQHDVGVKYFQGQGVEQDYQQAAYWWEQSANAGLADSQYNLGLMYYRGLGIQQDYKKAAELFLAAAEQGYSNAQYSLAVIHAFGQGMEKDYVKALIWFRKAAAQGVAQAQFNLGVLYENGYGLDKDLQIARQWYKQAADQGLQEARNKLAELDKRKIKEDKIIAHPEVDFLPSLVAEGGIKRRDWVIRQPPDTYTLQLVSLLSEKESLKYIKKNNLADNAAYFKVIVKGTARYTVIYGAYNTYNQAQRAIKQLPKNLREGNPWVRNFGILQGLLSKG